MSIGFLKRLLGFAMLAAGLIFAAAAWGYYSHRQSIQEAWKPPNFRPVVRVLKPQVARIDHLQMALGRYQRAVEPTAAVEEKAPTEDIMTALDKLGTIKSAIAVYPPYTGIIPAITFEYKQAPAGQTEKIRTIGLGEALEDRQDPERPTRRIPVRYKFIGCERDPEHPGWTYFLFDMKCDGTDIQKARWKLETDDAAKLKAATADDQDGIKAINSGKMYFGPVGGVPDKRKKPTRRTTGVETRPVDPPIITTVDDRLPSGSLFDEEEGGTFAPSREGVEYLKKNYKDILKDARTQTYRDRNGRPAGLQVTRIKGNSVATQFGLQSNDVILSINGKTVTKQADAVNIVKAELKRKQTIIRVKVLRRGREFEKRFDTRDPETRRMAKKFR